ncbi:hypothetical protein LINPERPRIM_LOCUS15189 [Linum perenne]
MSMFSTPPVEIERRKLVGVDSLPSAVKLVRSFRSLLL